jgi:hypothetical protein
MRVKDSGSQKKLRCVCQPVGVYDSAKRWVAPAVRRGLINPGKRQISVPRGGSTLTQHQILLLSLIRGPGLTPLVCADSINLYPAERQFRAVVPPFGGGIR